MKLKINPFRVLNEFNIRTKIVLAVFCLGSQLSNAQNTCATALPISAGTTTVALIDGTNIATGCATAALAEWYVYTPTANHSVTITSDLQVNICKDTHFNVYVGTCGALTCFTNDDDSGVIACNSGNTSSYLSVKTFDVVAGTTYYISWDNKWSNAGFDFQLIESPYIPSPCTTAIPVNAGITTVDAIDVPNITTACSSASLAKWYSYTPSQNYRVTLSSDLAVNICKDTNFSVYTGSCSGGLSCIASDDNSGVIACNSGNINSNLSKKTFDVNAGVTYYIVWDNRWSAGGFDFELTETPIVIPITYNIESMASINSTFNRCIVDMNADGKDDIVGVSDNNLRVHYQGASGFTYSDISISGTHYLPYWSIAAGDLNKDGYNDLLLGSGNGLTFWQSNNNGTGYTSITPGQYIFCQRTNFVDIDNDGNLDAFSCHDVAPNVYYMNNGAGVYTYYQSGVTPGAYSLGTTSSGGNYATLWTDLDNDGDVDVFVSKCSGPPCEIHRNDGNGVFTDISAIAQINFQPVQSWSSAIADFDNDGDMDILVGSNGGVKSVLFRNNLDTTNNVEEAYTNITLDSGWDTDTYINRDYVAYDFDNDGFVDIFNGNGRIMFNKGNGTFEASTYSGMNVGPVGDLNSDGFLDIMNDSTIHYAVPNGNKWLTVGLQGIQSNSNGIGARVEIYGAWGKQIRDIRSGEGFAYMSTLDAHFGLGNATTIDQVVVKWPSGIVDYYTDVQPNQRLLFREGSTLAVNNPMNNGVYSLYPNPAKHVLNVKSKDGVTMKSALIYDLNGRQVLKSEISNASINVEALTKGTYIIVLKDVNGKDYSQKFLKE